MFSHNSSLTAISLANDLSSLIVYLAKDNKSCGLDSQNSGPVFGILRQLHYAMKQRSFHDKGFVMGNESLKRENREACNVFQHK